MDEETVKIRWSIETNRIGSTVSDVYDTGMTRDEWDDLTAEEQNDIMQEVVFQNINWTYSEI